MATINISELATELNTDPRTTRKFLRSITPADAQPGKGSRWSIEKREVRSLKSKFTKFVQANEERAQAKNEAPEVNDEVEVLDDAEPTAEDLEALAFDTTNAD